MTKLNVFITHRAFYNYIMNLFIKYDFNIVNDVDDADVIVFSGGADINPFLYNNHRHPTTSFVDWYDTEEVGYYHRAQELGIPCVGICRGAQLLCALNNGELWQDVNGHANGDHEAFTFGTNIPVLVSSMHHQMLKLTNQTNEHIMLLVSHISTRKEAMSQLEDTSKVVKKVVLEGEVEDDIEAIFFPSTNSLCFQAHPELYAAGWPERYKPMADLFFSYIKQYSLGE